MAKGILFSGQGAQQVGMGHEVYEKNPIAKKLWDQANDILGFDLKQICFNGPEDQLTQTKICQPALYVHGYALYQVLKLEDVRVASGLSLGELTAHAAAGTYDFETGLRIVAERGRLMQEACEASNGSMASVIGGKIEDIEILCERNDVQIANLNSPGQVVISGDKQKIEAAIADAANFEFKRVIPLNVAGAYHSRLMLPACKPFESFLANIEFKQPRMPVFSNTTGADISEPAKIKEALVKQIVSSVRWEECMLNAAKLGVSEFYECGPGKVLKGLAKRIDPNISVHSVNNYEDISSMCAQPV